MDYELKAIDHRHNSIVGRPESHKQSQIIKGVPALECPFALQQLGPISHHEWGNPSDMLPKEIKKHMRTQNAESTTDKPLVVSFLLTGNS